MITRPIWVYVGDRLIGWVWPSQCQYAVLHDDGPPV